jgi:hypothetical protein
MTNDTLKSLGYLKKSLRMNFKAMVKNASQDGIDATELKIFAGHSKAMFDQIEVWEVAAVAAAPVTVPSGVVQPAPAAATVHTVTDADGAKAVSDGSDDLLTID